MSKFVNEELSKIKSLFGYKRGVVISEQDDRTTRAANAEYSCDAHPRSGLRNALGGGSKDNEVTYKDMWDEMTNWKKHPDLKEFKNDYKSYSKLHPDVTFEIYLSLKRDSERFSNYNTNPNYNKYFDNSGNVIQGQEDIAKGIEPWFQYYRKIFGANKKITIDDLYNYYSKKPNGITSFEAEVKNFYR